MIWVDLSIFACDGEVCVLHGHLVDVMMVEFEDELIIETKFIYAWADGDVVFWCVGKDGGDELDFLLYLSLLDFELKIGYFWVLL